MMAENQNTACGSPPQSDDFSAHESEVDGLAVVSVSGSVDMLTAPGLSEAIEAALAKNPKGLIVDLTKVEFLGSAPTGGRSLDLARKQDTTRTIKW